MKRYIYSLIAIMVVFSACKKDAINKSTNNGKQTPVTFDVGFAQSVGSFNGAHNLAKFTGHALATDSTLKADASVLYVTVYQSDGSNLIQTKQLSTDTAFGHVKFNLPAGTYTVAFAAGQANLFVSADPLSSAYALYSAPVSGGGFNNSWQSTFYQKINITVGSTGIVQSVSLNRIDSQIIVDIEDAIPSNVKFIAFTAVGNSTYSPYPQFSIATGAPTARSYDGLLLANSNIDTAVTPGTKNTRLYVTLLGSSSSYTVSIYAYDQLPLPNFNGQNFSGTQIGFFTTSTVTVQPGHQTILSGKLFGGNGLTNTGGFQMTVDPTWDTTTTTIPFQ